MNLNDINKTRDRDSRLHSWRFSGNQFSIANQLRYGLVALVAFAALLTGGLVTQLSFRSLWRQSILLQQERSKSAAQEIDVYLDSLKPTITLG